MPGNLEIERNCGESHVNIVDFDCDFGKCSSVLPSSE